jgi:hypothetical protein
VQDEAGERHAGAMRHGVNDREQRRHQRDEPRRQQPSPAPAACIYEGSDRDHGHRVIERQERMHEAVQEAVRVAVTGVRCGERREFRGGQRGEPAAPYPPRASHGPLPRRRAGP